MARLEDFTIMTPRPLPVLVLADTSGSMSVDGKIEALNDALHEMIASLAEEEGRAEIEVAIVTFGGASAVLHTPLTPAWKVALASPLAAAGKTPMGGAFGIAQEMLEDRDQIPSRAYQPTLVLVSDGQPTDDWRTPLQELLGSPRASKAVRLALAIGGDANREVLDAFLAGSSRLLEAHESRTIKTFFRWVTMSVSSRSRSLDPDSPDSIEPLDFGEIDF